MPPRGLKVNRCIEEALVDNLEEDLRQILCESRRPLVDFLRYLKLDG